MSKVFRAGFLLLNFLTAAVLFGEEVAPIAFGKAANSTFSDQTAEDRKGGWTDQGGNDLRAIPAGRGKFGGIAFEIVRSETAPECIVLGGQKERSYLPRQVEMKVPGTVRGRTLYLLHAGAWVVNGQHAGNLTVEYDGGAPSKFSLRNGREVLDWSSPRDGGNAKRVWSIYNGNTQVSLFVSRFALRDRPIRSIRFEAEDPVWMIAAVSVGTELPVYGITPRWLVKGKYAAPATPDRREIARLLPDKGPVRNVILIIGDGMGMGALLATSNYAHGRGQALYLQQLPHTGLVQTRSANADVTDSAAAGTALATGHKTNNRFVGMKPDRTAVDSIAAMAAAQGKSVGIITTDALVGATPSAFYAHVPARGMASEIACFAAKCGYDILIGNERNHAFRPDQRKDGRDLCAEMQKAGYHAVRTPDTLPAAAAKAYGFIGDWRKDITLLSQFTAAAAEKLGKNPKGFFLMVESSLPDSGGHGNDPDLTVLGTLMADFTVKAAVEYARRHKDTLVVVTADHETGGIVCNGNNVKQTAPVIFYSTNQHTSAPVGIYAGGPGSDRFGGVMENTSIPKTFAKLWELSPGKKGE
ncbi:MAG: alkaline phosphatase [Victivallaceae bacterium]|nr:alkaline phosphatase [Victivallaceae bacterium]